MAISKEVEDTSKLCNVAARDSSILETLCNTRFQEKQHFSLPNEKKSIEAKHVLHMH